MNRAGLSAAFVDRIVETKGLDYVDKEKAKHEGMQIIVNTKLRSFTDAITLFEQPTRSSTTLLLLITDWIVL